MSGEALTLANEQSLLNNTTRYLHITPLQAVTTTTTTTGKPTQERKEQHSRNKTDLPGQSDWLPGKEAMVTK